MDNQSAQTSTPYVAPRPRHKLFPILFVLLGIVLLGAGAYIYFNKEKQSTFYTNAPVKADTKIMTVGDETLYGADLLYQKEKYSKVNPAVAKFTDGELRTYYNSVIAQESITLQEGAKNKWIQLDSKVFNTQNKDYTKRETLLNEVINKLSEESTQKKWDAVIITYDPAAGASPSAQINPNKTKAKQIIDAIKADLDKNSTTIDAISKAPTKYLSELDSRNIHLYATTYESPSLMWSPMIDPAAFETIEKAPANQFTIVFEVKLLDRASLKFNDVAYATVKQVGTFKEFDTIEEWYNKTQERYTLNYH